MNTKETIANLSDLCIDLNAMEQVFGEIYNKKEYQQALQSAIEHLEKWEELKEWLGEKKKNTNWEDRERIYLMILTKIKELEE